MINYTPGDVKISLITLENQFKNIKINPSDQLLGCDIYEDITKPTLFGLFHFYDTVGILENFPIIGEETITIEFRTPTISKPTKIVLKCYEVSNVSRDNNDKGTYFTLKCVSEEHFRNNISIENSYDDIISNITTTLLFNKIKTKKKLVVDETKGIQKIVFPSIPVFQCIDMIRQRAVAKKYPGSLYVFFENQDGFHFKTIESLMEESRDLIGSRTFNIQNNSIETQKNDSSNFRTILDYAIVAKADNYKKTQLGMFGTVDDVFDLTTKKISQIDFNLDNVFDKLTGPDKKKQQPNSEEFKRLFGIKKGQFIPKDTSRPENFIDTMIAVRESFSLLLNSEVTRVKVNGDSGLKAGIVVNLKIPDPTGLNKNPKESQINSGNYFVTRLRHMITMSGVPKHEIVFDCVKVGIKK